MGHIMVTSPDDMHCKHLLHTTELELLEKGLSEEVRGFVPRTFGFDKPELLDIPSHQEWLAESTWRCGEKPKTEGHNTVTIGKDSSPPTLVASTIFRHYYVRFSFAILSREFIEDIVWLIRNMRKKRVVDLACGLGGLGFWINKLSGIPGIPCEMIDDCQWPGFAWRWSSFVVKQDVRQYLSNMTKNEADASLFILSWPPYEDPIAERIWDALPMGSVLLYIGEASEGCCATDDFFRKTENSVMQHFSEQLNKHFLSFWGCRDSAILLIKQ